MVVALCRVWLFQTIDHGFVAIDGALEDASRAIEVDLHVFLAR